MKIIITKTKTRRYIHASYETIWRCPSCGYEKPYDGSGSMKCDYCGKWMQAE